jgi:hypothetical protein
LSRAFCLFDASAIGDADTITAAVLDFFHVSTDFANGDNDGDDYISLNASSPATNTNLITADYSQVGGVEYGSAPDFGSLTSGAYNTVTLTAAGRELVSKTGVSKFVLREGHDFEDSAVADVNEAKFSSADHPGTSQDPKLTVTYTAAGGSDGLGVMMF